MERGNSTSYTKESATSSALRSKEMQIKFAVAVNPDTCPKILFQYSHRTGRVAQDEIDRVSDEQTFANLWLSAKNN